MKDNGHKVNNGRSLWAERKEKKKKKITMRIVKLESGFPEKLSFEILKTTLDKTLL